MRISSLFSPLLSLCLVSSLSAQTPAKRSISIEDMYRMQEVAAPQTSPDGKWVAYTVTSIDREADKRFTSIWIVSWDGIQDLRMTYGPQSAHAPRWSPDGKYLSFLAERSGDGKTQVWLLDRRGGDAFALTDVKGEISSYRWSPDGKRLVLEMSPAEEDEKQGDNSKTSGPQFKAPKPIVVDRSHFKEDVEGYLSAESRAQLYLFDVLTKKLEPLTTDRKFDDHDPVW